MLARKKTSLAEDLMDLMSLLPWWAGVVLAVIAHVLLHKLATPPTELALQPGQMGGLIVRSMGAVLAGIGQYAVPLICLSGAGVSAWRRHRRRTLISNMAQAKGADALDGMSWREFEMLVGEAFRLQGFSVSETGGGGADGGVDLVISKGTEKFLVQCKQWKAYKVGVDVVRELYGVMAAKGATGGFVVTSGSFSDDAKAFADGRNVKLVDGHRLFGLIKQARQSLSSRADIADRLHPVAPPSPPGVSTSTAACPACGSGMVKRTAKKGANAGGQFWGCSQYPSCRGVRPLA
ncbi:restriction endonuclease [Variovorax sp. GB1R11]|uniref:restriction endonuclease n=1 Tax=Variovorax sp. GB1R11 TaxID=3443741 RepID=UPI003F46DD7E